MNKKKIISTWLVGLMALAALPHLAQAQVLASWTFPLADTETGPVPATITDANTTVSSLSVTGMVQDRSTSDYFAEVSNAFLFESPTADNYPGTPPAINTADYVSFTVQPKTGDLLNLTGLEFYAGIQNATSNSYMDVKYSTDGFSTSTDLGKQAIPTWPAPNGVGQLYAFPLNLKNVTGSVQFRFYFVGSNGHGVGGIGNPNATTSGLVLYGTSSAVALVEPSLKVFKSSAGAVAVCGTGLLVFSLRRIRRSIVQRANHAK